MTNDPESLCKYVQCINPVEEEACPEGTFFMAGIAQYGCCGACVQFRGLNEACTGSIHPQYCGGYGIYGQSGDCSDPWRKLRDLRNSIEENLYTQDNVVRSSWCGYNIACGGSRVCEIDPTAKGCVYIQRRYDEARQPGSGLYLDYRDDYRWRPTCTKEGFFTEKQCKGPLGEQRCVCVDPDGNRLYGDAFSYQEDLFDSMNCKCSRRVWELQQAGEKSVTLHCAANGNYEPLQCEDGWCYCIDPATATPYGSRLPEGAMDRLDCYNKTLVGSQYLSDARASTTPTWNCMI
uniref:Thyroglobulin-like protein n=1 Tax=Penaeus monodon TaxID=6687 RepID=A0A189XGA9_PENMO|nr:thyroglobulin-like protein [Penaeus monodon]